MGGCQTHDINLENVKYSDMYGNLGQQIRAVKLGRKYSRSEPGN